eukprot:gene57598-76888_t
MGPADEPRDDGPLRSYRAGVNNGPMQKAERLSQQLQDLEREYLAVFARALSVCADGRWGLFGHNEHLHSLSVPAELGVLRELAATIDQVRARLGDAPFAIHAEFEA